MSYFGESIVMLLMVVFLLMAIGLLVYFYVSIRRLMMLCYSRMQYTFDAIVTMQAPYQQLQSQHSLAAGRRQNRKSLSYMVEHRLIGRYGNLMTLLGDLYEQIDGDNQKYHTYFHDLIDEMDRGGKISQLLKGCLANRAVKNYGLYGVLKVHCLDIMQRDFKSLKIMCNDESRRLDQDVEEELMITYLLLFIYFAFDRTPNEILLDLQFADSYVSFTISDDDTDGLSGLELNQIGIDSWPMPLRQAENFAALAKGFVEVDTAYTGLKFTLTSPYHADMFFLE